VVVEALTQHGMVPISPPSIYQALDNVHMLWMGTWIYHNAITNTCVNPGRCWKSLEILHHYWVTKDDIVKWLRLALTQNGVDPTSPSNI
jgi:hypothetical protein